MLKRGLRSRLALNSYSFAPTICYLLAGTLYLSEGSSRVRTIVNGIVHTVAGNGTSGYLGDNKPATSAELNGNNDIFYDSNTGKIFY